MVGGGHEVEDGGEEVEWGRRGGGDGKEKVEAKECGE